MGPNLKGKVVSASSKAQQESTFFRKLKRFLKRSKGLQVFFLGGGKCTPEKILATRMSGCVRVCGLLTVAYSY